MSNKNGGPTKIARTMYSFSLVLCGSENLEKKTLLQFVMKSGKYMINYYKILRMRVTLLDGCGEGNDTEIS